MKGKIKMSKIVTVQWWDEYEETFDCTEVRYGSDLLWMRLKNGSNRHIPTRHIRWFSVDNKICTPPIEKTDKINVLNVRWFDGYLKEFKCMSVEIGCDIIHIQLTDDSNIYIPTRQVRWYSTSIESHEITTTETFIQVSITHD